MKTQFFYLSTCDTCRRIIKEHQLQDLDMQDLKQQHISAEQLDELQAQAGSYETLLNKRSREYKARDLKNANLTEAQIKEQILSHYTLLKRPILITDDELVIGSAAFKNR